MNFTLLGYPKTGKTTLFNLLTGANIQIQNYDGGKKEPNLRTCPVPDDRFDKVAALFPDKQKKPALIDYTDLAGMAYGEMKNESYLDYLRKADGLTHVVRDFQNDMIPHAKGKIDAASDIRSMEEEIVLADLLAVESRIEKLDKELKRNKSSEGEKEMDLMVKLKGHLEQGRALRSVELHSHEEKFIRSFAFLSRKPLLHMVNIDENRIGDPGMEDETSSISETKTVILHFCGKIELEILELEDEEKEVFLHEYGMQELSSARFLRTSYDLLNVITFFTVGKAEVKAWTIPRKTTALDAAGEIHSDIQKGFIRAEVIAWDELIGLGSFQSAKDKGAVRLEGKTYVVQDGDVIYFRFSK